MNRRRESLDVRVGRKEERTFSDGKTNIFISSEYGSDQFSFLSWGTVIDDGSQSNPRTCTKLCVMQSVELARFGVSNF
jgi:hypothetical protein